MNRNRYMKKISIFTDGKYNLMFEMHSLLK